MMKRWKLASRVRIPDTISRHDDVGKWLREAVVLDPTNATADDVAAERWARLSQRINAHRHLNALIAHFNRPCPELHRATLFLRPQSALTVLIV